MRSISAAGACRSGDLPIRMLHHLRWGARARAEAAASGALFRAYPSEVAEADAADSAVGAEARRLGAGTRSRHELFFAWPPCETPLRKRCSWKWNVCVCV